MADTIKCTCEHCGAKYRLPVEAQGRSARCKRCGKRFEIPREQSLEDSVLTWLMAPEDEEVDEETPAQPRVINMPQHEDNNGEDKASAPQKRGTIRIKGAPKGETA